MGRRLRILLALVVFVPSLVQASGWIVWENDKIFSYPDECLEADCPVRYAELANFPDEFWDRLVFGSFGSGGSFFWLGEWDGKGWVSTCNHCGAPSLIEFVYGPHDGKIYKYTSEVFHAGKTASTDFHLVSYAPFARADMCEGEGDPHGCCTGPLEGNGTGACSSETTEPLPGYAHAPTYMGKITDLSFPALGLVAGAGNYCAKPGSAWYLECNSDPARGGQETPPACCTGVEYTDEVCLIQPGLGEACIGGEGIVATCDVDPEAPLTYLGTVYAACTSIGTPFTTRGGLTRHYTWREIEIFDAGRTMERLAQLPQSFVIRAVPPTSSTFPYEKQECRATCVVPAGWVEWQPGFPMDCSGGAASPLSRVACGLDHASQDAASSGDSGSPAFLYDVANSRWLYFGPAATGAGGVHPISTMRAMWMRARYGEGAQP